MPAGLFLWLFLVGIYVVVRLVRHVRFRTIRIDLGLTLGPWHWYALSLVVAVLAAGIAALIVWFGGFSSLIRSPHYAQAHYAAWPLGISTIALAFVREVIYTAFGEELLFRGVVAGVLFRRMEFQAANALQTLVFLLPHLAILPLAGVRYWPLLIPVVVGGWLLGWLRFKSGSILPGMVTHGVVNTVAAAFVMAAA